MTYTFIFEPDYTRMIPCVLTDCRASIPEIKNKTGYEIKAWIDGQIALINEQTIVYCIETNLGVKAGFFAVQVNTENKTGQLLMKQLRPAFKQLQLAVDISLQITNFIANNLFAPDYLFDN